MKYVVLLVIATFLSLSSHAESCSSAEQVSQTESKRDINTDAPDFLKGATIIVRLANGKESSVPAEKYKVVPRKQQFITTEVKTATLKTCSADPRRNRISLVAGEGPTGHLDRDGSNAPGYATVEAERGAVAGAQYQYLTPFFHNRLSFGAQGTTNKEVLGVVGYEF